jgi:hypothetical protein
MRRKIERTYDLNEEDICEAIMLLLKARDMPIPIGDEYPSIKSRGVDLTEIEFSWTSKDTQP